MQVHVHEEIDHVEFMVKAPGSQEVVSVSFIFREPAADRPGDWPMVTFWIRSERHREALRLALQSALAALEDRDP